MRRELFRWVLTLVITPMIIEASEVRKGPNPEIQALSDSIQLQTTALKQLTDLTRGLKDNSARSADIFERRVETLEQIARAQFEYANLTAVEKGDAASVNLVPYKNTLREIVAACTQYIDRFPKGSGFQAILLTRGKTYQTLELETLAAADFEKLAFSTTKNSTSMVGAVALIASDSARGRFENVVKAVDQLKLQSSDQYYAEVQIKKAGALSKLDRDAEAVKLIQGLLPWLMANYKVQGSHVTEDAVREGQTTAVEVLVKGLSKKIEGLTLPGIAKILSQNLPKEVSFSPLEGLSLQLIAKDLHSSLDELDAYAGDLVRGKNPLDVLARFQMICLEHDLDQKFYKQAIFVMKKLAPLLKNKDFSPKSGEKLYRSLTRAIENTRQARAKAEGKMAAEALKESDQFLVQAYALALEVPQHPAQDEQAIYFNLAEVAFRQGAFAMATEYYLKASKTVSAKNPIKDLELKLMASRYEELLAKNVFPKDLKPVALASTSVKKLPVEPLLLEWMGWVDRMSPAPEQRSTWEKFSFEVTRSLYANFDTQKAMDRAYQSVLSSPSQSIRLKSALLYFDTLLESKDWASMQQKSKELLTALAQTPPQAELLEKLNWYRSHSEFQLMAAQFVAKNFPVVIKMGQAHLATYPASIHKDEVNNMLGLSSVALGDRVGAKTYFSKVDMSKASGQTKNVILANELDSNLEKMDFRASSLSYLTLIQSGSLTSAPEKNNAILAALDLAWVSQDAEVLSKVVTDLCTSKATDAAVQASCVDQSLWLEMISKGSASTAAIAARSGASDFGKAIAYTRRVKSGTGELKELASAWAVLSPIQKTALIPFVDSAIRAAASAQREKIRKASPIKLEKSAIEKRARLLSELEKWAEYTKKLDWVAINYFYLKNVALAYQDFSRDIEAIPLPKGFAEPEKLQFKQMISQNAAPFQKVASNYDQAARALNAKKSLGMDLSTLLPAVQMAKSDPVYQKALEMAVKGQKTLVLSQLIDVAKKKNLFQGVGEKVQMAMVLYLSGGYTESEQLFREANVADAVSKFKFIEAPVTVPVNAPKTGAGT